MIIVLLTGIQNVSVWRIKNSVIVVPILIWARNPAVTIAPWMEMVILTVPRGCSVIQIAECSYAGLGVLTSVLLFLTAVHQTYTIHCVKSFAIQNGGEKKIFANAN